VAAPNAWPALDVYTRGQIKRLNTPNSKNVRDLFSTTVGASDVTTGWCYRGRGANVATTIDNPPAPG